MGEQGRLADACLTLDGDDRAGAAGGGRERIREHLALVFALAQLWSDRESEIGLGHVNGAREGFGARARVDGAPGQPSACRYSQGRELSADMRPTGAGAAAAAGVTPSSALRVAVPRA